MPSTGTESRPADACDAIVVFGITGDLAYKKILPALHNLSQRGRLGVPVIGVARADRTEPWLRDRVRSSISENVDSPDPIAVEEIEKQLTFIAGDYSSPDTFTELKKVLAESHCPLY